MDQKTGETREKRESWQLRVVTKCLITNAWLNVFIPKLKLLECLFLF